MMGEFLITTILEGERAYFQALRPSASGNGGAVDCAWTTQRGHATVFRLRAAAVDTAIAVGDGEVVDR